VKAFAELVRRHIDLVHSAAVRMVNDPHLAKDVSQGVFVALAKDAGKLTDHPVLAGWLHRTTRNIAAQTVRTDVRRRNREKEAAAMNEYPEPDAAWEEISPHLDAAIAELSEPDRDAVLLRYFENKPAQEMAAMLGISAEAAQKRVSRAVDRLRDLLARRGIKAGAGGFAIALSANTVQAAPVGLAKSISAIALAKGTVTIGSGAAVVKGMGSMGGLFAPWFFAPWFGSVFFLLKSEIENGKSPRERQLIARMIWLRFTVAIVIFTAVFVIGMTMASFFIIQEKHLAVNYQVFVILRTMTSLIMTPGVIEFSLVGIFFLSAVENGARAVYFHRRRRQIQIEDGTLEDIDSGGPGKPGELLGDLMGGTSKANQSAAISTAFGLLCCFVATPYLLNYFVSRGFWIAAGLQLVWSAFAIFRWLRNWRRRPRQVFDAGVGKLVRPIMCIGVVSLLIIDFSWAKGRLPLSNEWAIGCNVLLVVAYAGLIRIVSRLHVQPPALTAPAPH